jgi:hypothetical protein
MILASVVGVDIDASEFESYVTLQINGGQGGANVPLALSKRTSEDYYQRMVYSRGRT